MFPYYYIIIDKYMQEIFAGIGLLKMKLRTHCFMRQPHSLLQFSLFILDIRVYDDFVMVILRRHINRFGRCFALLIQAVEDYMSDTQ